MSKTIADRIRALDVGGTTTVATTRNTASVIASNLKHKEFKGKRVFEVKAVAKGARVRRIK